MRNSTTYLHDIPALQQRFVRETENALNASVSVAGDFDSEEPTIPTFSASDRAWFRGVRS